MVALCCWVKVWKPKGSLVSEMSLKDVWGLEEMRLKGVTTAIVREVESTKLFSLS